MLKQLLLLLCMAITISCGSRKSGSASHTQAAEVLTYESLGNDVANISLAFYGNNTFRLQFESLASDAATEESAFIDATGKYTTDGDWKTLRFSKPKFSVGAVFDPRFSKGNDFEVINERTVRINTTQETIAIWGVMCEK